MLNFVIKFINISSIIFLLNILLFAILVNIFSVDYALLSTLIIIFILNFFFICYSFDIKKYRLYFLLGLIILSLNFRFIEYNLFIQLIKTFEKPTLTWFITIFLSFGLKIFVYKFYFNLNFFKTESKKKKIYIFSPDLKNGGAERNVHLLSELLDPIKFEIKTILWSKLNRNKIHKKKFFIKKKNLKSSFFKILFLIIKNKPDYIFSSLNHMNIFLTILKVLSGVNSKLIIRESNYLSYKLIDELNRNKIKIFLRRFLTFITYNICEIIICPSREIMKDLNNNFFINEKKLRFIPNLFKKKKISKLKSKIPFSNYIIGVGRLEAQKDYDFMIKAFNKSLEYKNNKLLIVGNGSKRDYLLNLIKKLSLEKQIQIIDFNKNIQKFLSKSNGLLLTSNYEGMPNIILEATSLGVKCLITNFPGSSFFKKYKNIKITKKNLKDYSNQIIKLNSKRIIPKLFHKDFIEKKSQQNFLNCFK